MPFTRGFQLLVLLLEILVRVLDKLKFFLQVDDATEGTVPFGLRQARSIYNKTRISVEEKQMIITREK